MSVSTRRLAAAAVTLASLVPHGTARAAPCWSLPVAAPVSDPFRRPDCRWCPGNRGIEYGTPPGRPVTAIATGRVSYAGTVAGVVYLVVRLGDGRRVTYGNLRSRTHSVGELVVRGSTIGTTAGAFHLGLREGDAYVDPAPYLGRLVNRPRLIPNDDQRPNPPGRPQLTCRRA